MGKHSPEEKESVSWNFFNKRPTPTAKNAENFLEKIYKEADKVITDAIGVSTNDFMWKSHEEKMNKAIRYSTDEYFYRWWLDRVIEWVGHAVYWSVFDRVKAELYGNDPKWERKADKKALDAVEKFKKAFA